MELKGSLTQQQWVKEYGEFKFYADVLADFDPVKSNKILNNCSHQDIINRLLSRKKFYNSDGK